MYSDTQEIFVEKNIDNYELRFKYDSYGEELLELFDGYFNEMILDKCITQNNKELICTITRTNIEEILAYNGEIFNIGALDNNYGTYYFINTVLSIKFNYDNVTKENILIDITKLKENIAEKNHLIAYETNVDNINNVITESFKLNFNNYGEAVCFFKKSENTNLLLLCRFVYEGTYSLKSTEEQIVLNDINIMYNFIILPIKNNESFNITKEYNTFIFSSHPRIIDSLIKIQNFSVSHCLQMI